MEQENTQNPMPSSDQMGQPKQEENAIGKGSFSAKLDGINRKLDMLVDKDSYVIDDKFALLSNKWKLKHDKKMLRLKLGRGMGKGKLKKLYKKDRVLVFLLKRDRVIQPMIGQMINGLIHLKERDNYYNGSADFTFLFRGKVPAAVIPEWNLNPIGTWDYYQAVEKKSTIEPQQVVIRAMRLVETEGKKKMKMGSWIFIIIGAAIIGYIIFASMKKKGG